MSHRLILLALAAVLAGCGNGGQSAAPGGSGAPLAPSVFPSVPSSDETMPPGDAPTASPSQAPGASAVAT